MKKVLVVEDDQDISDLLKLHLSDLGCQTTCINNGKDALAEACSNHFDLIILDIMLPKMNGIDVCRELRNREIHIPVLMLTAKAEELDKVAGLESGADDYLTKPFGIRELLARVKAMLRRAADFSSQEGQQETILSYADIVLNFVNRQVKRGDQILDLTPKEFDLLCMFCRYPGRSFTREEMLNRVWGYEFSGYEHTVNSHINRLRSKLEPNDTQPRYILTTWGVGYRLNDAL